MNLLVAIIVGGLIGWIAARIVGRETGIIGSVVIGVVGSLIGSLVSVLITGGDQSYLAFSWPGIFWSFIGALLLVILLNALQRNSSN